MLIFYFRQNLINQTTNSLPTLQFQEIAKYIKQSKLN